MTNQLLLLTSINNRIDQISFPKTNFNSNAKFLCHILFNNFIKDGSDFQTPIDFSANYLKTIIRRNEDRALILKELKNAGILTATTYSTGRVATDQYKGTKAYPKAYAFGHNYIYNSPIVFSQFKNINTTDDRKKFKELNKTLEVVTVDPAVYAFIPKLINDQIKTLEIGDQITNKMIRKTLNKQEISKPLCYWLKVATRNNVALLKFNDKFYLEGVKSFIERKTIELEISYTYTIDQIKIGNYYTDRNETNNRLDYNMTALKKELFPYIILDGEKTEEIDIANAQFSLLSNLPNWNLDNNFIEKARSGELYKFIGSELQMTTEDVKSYLFVVAFGEVEYHPKALNELFPTTMQSITDFKNEYGYNQLAILLQKAESNLMIDGVFRLLYEDNIKVLPVHDSMRVKKSEAKKVKKMMEKFFVEKDFKCALKNK